MPFSDFKNMEQVIEQFPLILERKDIFPLNLSFELPEWFAENLAFTLKTLKSSDTEAVYCEKLIYPFLHLVWKNHPHLNLWSHHNLRYYDVLHGTPDFFVSKLLRDNAYEMMTPPLLTIVQPKNENFIEGWGQCLAEMIACQKINNDETLTIYGIVTTGTSWEFSKLTGDTLCKHTISFSIGHPEEVVGILDFVFTECGSQKIQSPKS